MSVGEVDEFDSETGLIYNNCIRPVFIMIMDLSDRNKQEIKSYIKMLKRAGEKYSNFMLFAYGDANGEALTGIKEIIGKVPGAMLRFTDKSTIQYPQDWVFDDSHMDRFVEMYLRRQFNKTRSLDTQSSIVRELYKGLSAVKIIEDAVFEEIVFDASNSIFVFFFSSAEELSK